MRQGERRDIGDPSCQFLGHRKRQGIDINRHFRDGQRDIWEVKRVASEADLTRNSTGKDEQVGRGPLDIHDVTDAKVQILDQDPDNQLSEIRPELLEFKGAAEEQTANI